MPFAPNARPAALALAAPLIILLPACSSQTPPKQNAPQSQPEPNSGRRPAAIALGQRIEWNQLEPALAEARGSEVLEEAILDVAIDQEMTRAGISIPSTAIATERELVVLAVAEESQVSRDQAADLIEDLRRVRGLGPKRFNAQLLRNAKLRALVREGVRITPEEVSLARTLNYGPRARVRLIVTSAERDAAQIRSTLASLSGDQLRAEFSRLAMERSKDVSASRGGDLGVISPDDPSLPVPLQQALRNSPAGTLTDLVISGDGYYLAYVESTFAPATPPADSEIERRVRLRKERVAMDELSNRLIAGANITVFDESLRWSWEKRR